MTAEPRTVPPGTLQPGTLQPGILQVVVTRPRVEAEDLAGELARLGYRPLIAPMLEIEIVDAPPTSLDRYGALAFTSANGARAFAAQSPERDIPAYAVGDATATVLRAAGFTHVLLADGDGDALATIIAATMVAATADRRPILHISGRSIARDLGVILGPLGIAVDRVALYDARPATELPRSLVASLYACTVSGVLLFSARTAATFAALVNGAGLTRMVCSTTAICLSDQVAASASTLPFRSVKVAGKPRMQDMLALLPPSGV